MNKTTIRQGTIDVSIMALYTALKDGEEIESDDFLVTIKEFIEASTGITVNLMKSIIRESTRKVDFQRLVSEAPYKTVNELSKEFNVSTDTVRSYCNRNNIRYKRSPYYHGGR